MIVIYFLNKIQNYACKLELVPRNLQCNLQSSLVMEMAAVMRRFEILGSLEVSSACRVSSTSTIESSTMFTGTSTQKLAMGPGSKFTDKFVNGAKSSESKKTIRSYLSVYYPNHNYCFA